MELYFRMETWYQLGEKHETSGFADVKVEWPALSNRRTERFALCWIKLCNLLRVIGKCFQRQWWTIRTCTWSIFTHFLCSSLVQSLLKLSFRKSGLKNLCVGVLQTEKDHWWGLGSEIHPVKGCSLDEHTEVEFFVSCHRDRKPPRTIAYQPLCGVARVWVPQEHKSRTDLLILWRNSCQQQKKQVFWDAWTSIRQS